ncbi:MAG: ATPase, T2SS/T4P/T4SS family, partial [Elusimicrobiota bacterium]|nr:ATPase, T2SS/T4P/T4SS family [Elusimicrobiota bacterium]
MCADRRQKIGLDSIRDSHRARVKRHGFDRRKPPLLENILRELDVIDAEQFEKAKRHALSTGIDICSALVDLEYIREDRLALWLSIKAGLPFITSLKEHATEDAAELIPEKFARRFVIVPLFKRGGAVTAAVANPYDIPALDMILKVTGYSVIPVVSVRSEIFEMIDRIYSGDNAIFEKETGENEEADIVEKEASADSTEEAVVEDKESADESGLGADPEPEDEESGPDKIEIERYGQGKKDKSYDKDIIAEINKIFEKAVKHGASDIHFDPGDSCVYLRFRVDGMLKDIKELPKSIEKSLVARIKLMAALDITETRRPQDG